MLSEIRIGARVHVSKMPGHACQNPDCAAHPVVGTVVNVPPTPLDASYSVRLPYAGEATYVGRTIEAI